MDYCQTIEDAFIKRCESENKELTIGFWFKVDFSVSQAQILVGGRGLGPLTPACKASLIKGGNYLPSFTMYRMSHYSLFVVKLR